MMGAPKRHQSQQNYGTPPEFIEAVTRRFGPIYYDLAAEDNNTVSDRWIGVVQNSLQQNWAELLEGRLGWLNPPFNEIPAWAEKCSLEAARGAHILFLVPASIGTNWYWSYCRPFQTMALSPRMSFRGAPIDKKTGKPQIFMKDLMLIKFSPHPISSFERWIWKEKLRGGGGLPINPAAVFPINPEGLITPIHLWKKV